MPLTLKKVGSIFVCLSVQIFFKARVLKFHIWISHKKLLTLIFCPNYLSLWSYAPFKGQSAFFKSDISKRIETRSCKLFSADIG